MITEPMGAQRYQAGNLPPTPPSENPASTPTPPTADELRRADDVRRSMRSMHISFPSWIEMFPDAVERGRVKEWAHALHCYVDLIASIGESPKSNEPDQDGVKK